VKITPGLYLSFFCFVVLLAPFTPAEGEDGILCISEFVCDPQTGEIRADYDDPASECYPEWQAQCANYTANMMEQNLSQCYSRVDRVRDRLRAARERNRKRLKRIRNLRSRIQEIR